MYQLPQRSLAINGLSELASPSPSCAFSWAFLSGRGGLKAARTRSTNSASARHDLRRLWIVRLLRRRVERTDDREGCVEERKWRSDWVRFDIIMCGGLRGSLVVRSVTVGEFAWVRSWVKDIWVGLASYSVGIWDSPFLNH